MTRPIEAVVAEAQQRLERSGRLDITAFVSAYPEHEAELREILPVMLNLHQEKRWKRAESQSQAFAVGLFAQLVEQPEATTVGSLFAREREEAGLSLEEQARRLGLPASSLEQLAQEEAPLSLDNAAIKRLAAKVSAPFSTLLKEIRRLTSIESLAPRNPGAVFTRHKETSSEEERQALLERVRKSARKPPEEQ